MNASSTRDPLVVQATRLRYARIPLLLALVFTLLLVLRVPFAQSRKSDAQVTVNDATSTATGPVEVSASSSQAASDEADAGVDGRAQPSAAAVSEMEDVEPAAAAAANAVAPTARNVTEAVAREAITVGESSNDAEGEAQVAQQDLPTSTHEREESAAKRETWTPEVMTRKDSRPAEVADVVPEVFSQPSNESNVPESDSTGEESNLPEQQSAESKALTTLTLHNPHRSGGQIYYMVDGKVYSLYPGQAHELEGGPTWLVEFHRGGSFGDVIETLSGGSYVFQVSDNGWTLIADPGTVRQPPSHPPQSNR